MEDQAIYGDDSQFPHEEDKFVVDDVCKIIKDAIETTIGDSSFDQDRVPNWCTEIADKCIAELSEQRKPFKYITNVCLMQKNGGGLIAANSCYLNTESDGSCTIRWENQTIYCIVSVFGLTI